MQCKEVREKIFEYIEHNLSQKEACDFEEHMKSCKNCQEEYEQREKMIIKLKNLKDVEPPKNLKNKIMENIVKEENKSKRFIFKRYSLVAASLLIFISAGYIINRKELNIQKINKSNQPTQNGMTRSIEPVPFNETSEEGVEIFNNEESKLPYTYERDITLDDNIMSFEHYINFKKNQFCDVKIENKSDKDILAYVEDLNGNKVTQDFLVKNKGEKIEFELSEFLSDEGNLSESYVINLKSMDKKGIQAYFKVEIYENKKN